MPISRAKKRATRRIGVLLAAIGLLPGAGPASGGPAGIAQVKTLVGPAYVEHEGHRERLERGDRLSRGDWVETGRSGALGLAFRDNTMVSIGPETRIRLRNYAFEPAEGDLGFVLDLARGTLVYISGIIAKLKPDAVEIKTPASTVAVRGTRFLAKVEPER